MKVLFFFFPSFFSSIHHSHLYYSPGLGHCLVIADPINSSFIACWDVNFGNKPRGLDMLMCPETCLENFCFSAVYINMINDRTTEKSIFKSSFHSLGFFIW